VTGVIRGQTIHFSRVARTLFMAVQLLGVLFAIAWRPEHFCALHLGKTRGSASNGGKPAFS
jgi:hypothetical protein